MTLQELIELLKTAESFDEINEKREEIALLIPEVSVMFDYDQNNSYHLYDLWEHCVRTALDIPKDNTDDMLFLAALIHDIGKPECRCAGRKTEDTESHYYGHPAVSKRIVEEKVIPRLELSEDDALRLIYYVELHDDHVGFKAKHLRKHYERVPLWMFRNLMLLQMADAITHDMEKELICERYMICRELYRGKAGELYQWLEDEKNTKRKKVSSNKKISLYVGVRHIMDFDLIGDEYGESIIIYDERSTQNLIRGAYEYIKVSQGGTLSNVSLCKMFNYYMGGNFTVKEYIEHIMQHGFYSPYQPAFRIEVKEF